MLGLIQEYKESLRIIRKLKSKYPQRKKDRTLEQDQDFGYLSNMETNLNFIIKWLTTGRQPGNIRGVERLDAYQREVLMDPLWFDQDEKYSKPFYPQKNYTLPDDVMNMIDEVLNRLSPREREVFILSRGHCFSFQEIGDLLGISRNTVGELMKRAERKLDGYKSNINI